MSPLAIVLIVVIITVVTIANFVLWLRLRANRHKVENERPIDGLKR